MELLPIEQLVRTHSPWHWIYFIGHIALESLHQIIRRGIQLTHLRDRDRFRAQRGDPPKWQYAKVGLLNDLWNLNHSSLRSEFYAHRLIYDKGWHGGNRGKTVAPITHTQEDWTAYALCGMKDLQHHWIRECHHPPTENIRRTAESSVTDIIMKLRVPTFKRTKRSWPPTHDRTASRVCQQCGGLRWTSLAWGHLYQHDSPIPATWTWLQHTYLQTLLSIQSI